jgi:hypothetical protein
MTSKAYQIAEQVRATRREMATLAARGWHWFTITPDGRIASRHRSERGALHNMNDYMRAQGCRVWSYGIARDTSDA